MNMSAALSLVRERSTGTADRIQAEIAFAEWMHRRGHRAGPSDPTEILITDTFAASFFVGGQLGYIKEVRNSLDLTRIEFRLQWSFRALFLRLSHLDLRGTN